MRSTLKKRLSAQRKVVNIDTISHSSSLQLIYTYLSAMINLKISLKKKHFNLFKEEYFIYIYFFNVAAF